MYLNRSRRLVDVTPEILEALSSTTIQPAAQSAHADIHHETVWVSMRDGARLATDVYLPMHVPAPAIAMRTPYGRASPKVLRTLVALAQKGYVVIAQDCRGTGDSEPDSWDYYVYEPEDGLDFVAWVTQQQWFDGFLGSLGSSYVAQTQWCMAVHPRMSAIVPEVSGIGVAPRTARKYMFYNAYARSVGKGANKIAMSYEELERDILHETLAGGYFNEPLEQPLPDRILENYPELRGIGSVQAKHQLWQHYCSLTCAQRSEFIKQALGVAEISILDIEAMTAIFGPVPHDAFTVPQPQRADLCRALHAPALMITGWYDWSMNDALATWALLLSEAPDPIRSACRLVITPSAHNAPGYHEGEQNHAELRHSHRVQNHPELLLLWYEAVRNHTLDRWPNVIFYLMGANIWRATSAWPPPEAERTELYLGEGGRLEGQRPQRSSHPSEYVYDPDDPTPTVGGSVVSSVYAPGSVDVSEVQRRSDVLSFTTAPLAEDLDVIGPLGLIMYASSSAVDTDFCARLSDVFPGGRAIQLQNGIVRARYRCSGVESELLEPGRIYRFEIDMWATATRFQAGHCVRVDISSADFPRFDRNANLGGRPGAPVCAHQTIYHDPERPSHLELHVAHAHPAADERSEASEGRSHE